MRFHQFRTVGVVLSAVMVALSAFASPALAANTRDIYFGSPDTSTAPGTDTFGANGDLVFTPARLGGLSAVTVLVRNDGTQTINHVSLLGGYAADTAAVNPLFPPPETTTGEQLPSLPDPLTFANAFPTASCTIGPDGSGNPNRSLDCDLGTLTAGASQAFTVVINTNAASIDSYLVWFGLYLAETNSTGTNQDNFYAKGWLTISAPTCPSDPSGRKDADYFLPDSTVSLLTCTPANTVGTSQGSLTSQGNLTGQGGYGQVSISSDPLTCPAGYACYGTGVVADVLEGGPVPGGLVWTITWTGVKSLSGVIHFWDTYDATDPAHASDYTVIPFTKKSQCSARLSFDCWVSTQGSKGNADPWWFTATFITKNNGKAGGFF